MHYEVFACTVYKSAYLYKLSTSIYSNILNYCITVRRDDLNPSWGLQSSHSKGKTALTLKDSPSSFCRCQNTEKPTSTNESKTTVQLSRTVGKSHRAAGRWISAHLEKKIHGAIIALSLSLSLSE